MTQALEQLEHFANLDLGRAARTGIPEVVLAERKTPAHTLAIAQRLLHDLGRVLISRVPAETLALLPSRHPTQPPLLEIGQHLAEGLQQTQHHQTGLWYQVVDKGEHDGNWHDTSGSAMFVYFLQHMIDLGYLDAEQYRPSVERGYAGIVGKMAIGSDGLVDIYDACDGVCVQRSYADYIHYPRRINAKEALGSVLWATTIVEKPTNQCCLSPSGEPQS